MKPYGREKKLQGTGQWKVDVHPPKGYVNWWENMCAFLSRTTMKRNWKKDVNNELKHIYQGKDHLPNFKTKEECQHWCDNDSPFSIPKEEPKQNCKDCNKSLEVCTCIEDTVNFEEPKQDKIMERFIRNAKQQETIEEASIEWIRQPKLISEKESFIAGAKWKQERSYSEEEVMPVIKYIQWVIKKIDKGDTPEEIVRLILFYRDKIEQFKNE